MDEAGCWRNFGYMGNSGNTDCQLASKRVLKEFADDTLAILADCLFQNWAALTLKASW